MNPEDIVRQLRHINLKLALIIEPNIRDGVINTLQKILSQMSFIQEEIENILFLLNNPEDVLIRL